MFTNLPFWKLSLAMIIIYSNKLLCFSAAQNTIIKPTVMQFSRLWDCALSHARPIEIVGISGHYIMHKSLI